MKTSDQNADLIWANLAEKKIPDFRLHYLDGVRGLSALYVVVTHIYLIGIKDSLSDTAQQIFRFLDYGRTAVCVFIILSGYCLMIPVIRNSHQGILPHGFWNYIQRRCLRILPPYYVTLLLSIVLILCIPNLWSGTYLKEQGSISLNIFLSHMLLLHNLNTGWAYQLNSSLWSVATEWQIYFFFPLLLLPIWRRWGILTMLLAAYICGLILHSIFPEACFWFLGLFGIGVSAAAISFSENPKIANLRTHFPWQWFLLFLTTICLAIAFFHIDRVSHNYKFVPDTLNGLLVATLLIYCTRFFTEGKTRYPTVLKVLGSSWAVFLGTFSYSLYLTHVLVLGVIVFYLNQTNLSIIEKSLVLTIGAIPLSLLFAYCFYYLFERPFLYIKQIKFSVLKVK